MTKPDRSLSSQESGFTLLEVVIAVAILAVLSFYTAESIQKAAQSKVKVQSDIERISSVRDAMRVMERDVQTAFNYRDINTELYNLAGKEREKKSQAKTDKETEKDNKRTATPPPDKTKNPEDEEATAAAGEKKPFKPKTLKVITQFIGEEASMHFTSLNNTRTQQDEKASDQMEVGYFLNSCRGRLKPDASSQCLFRRSSPIIDKEVDKGGKEVMMLENVTRFELRYLPLEPGAEWVKEWRSDESGDARTQKRFPLAVEITLEMQNKNKKNSKPTLMTIVAEIRNPNNPTQEASDGNQNPNLEGTPPPDGTPAEAEQ